MHDLSLYYLDNINFTQHEAKRVIHISKTCMVVFFGTLLCRKQTRFNGINEYMSQTAVLSSAKASYFKF
jgi:hypothetical protein